jgi:DNA-binding IclR family transcriptional regulator
MTAAVKSSDRTLEVLEALATDRRRTLGELTRELGIPKSSLHGILRTMTDRGWVEQDGAHYKLGLRALQVGAAYLEADDTIGMLDAVLDALAAEFGETVHLGRLDGPFVVYVAKRESVHPLRLYSSIGRRLPAHATALGKALLAERPPDELPTALQRLTAYTITDPEVLATELEAIRARGYAVDREENTEGIVCVARTMPTGDAISLSVPATRIDDALITRIATALQDARDQVRISNRMLG